MTIYMISYFVANKDEKRTS